MTYDQLLAEAAAADRQAEALYAKIEAARAKCLPDERGTRPLIPAGFEACYEEAIELCRDAEWLRAEADELKPSSATPALTPPPALPHLQPAAGTPLQSEPAPDPIEAVVARIMKA